METLVKTVDLTESHEPEDGLSIGSLAGRWRIEHELGRGGMGIVYAVVHADIGKRAALKILHRQLFESSSHRDRVLTEARVVNQIDHPNIVDIFDTGTLADGRSYIVMERLDGCSLAQHAAKTKILPEDAITMLITMCDALHAAHEVGVLHRDLKLDNVFVDEADHRITLLDWGIAKIIAQEVGATREGLLAGTPQYASPEQARGTKLTPKSDVYSLGVMAYQLFLETLPFEASSVVEVLAMHLQTPPPPPRELWPEIPRPLEALLLAMLAKQPDDRPSLPEVTQRLETIQAELADRRSSSWERIVAGDIPTEAVELPRATRWIAPAPTLPPDLAGKPARWRYVVGVASLVALALLLAFVRDDVPSDRNDGVREESDLPAAATVAPPLSSLEPIAKTVEERTTRPRRPTPKPVPPTKAARIVTSPPPAETVAAPARPTAPIVTAPTADAVVAQYTALGQKLADAPRQRELSALWSRYRRLQIQEALATADRRAHAARLLEQLAADLAARR